MPLYDNMTQEKNNDHQALDIARHLLSQEGTGPAWGIEILSASPGKAAIAMTLKPKMLNGFGTAHGGVIFAFADTAFAYACNSRNIVSVAQQASISFLSPANNGEKLMAVASEEALSGRSGVYRVEVLGEDGRTIALFQGLSRSLNKPVIDGDNAH